jgi:hypothetical protein
MINLYGAAAAGVLVLAAPVAAAAEWKHELAPYMFFAGMDGSTGVGPVIADVDVSFGDVVENLEMGFMGMYRGTTGRYSIILDTIYMGLGATNRGPDGFLKGDVDMDQLALEADFGYALGESFTVLAGLRYNDLSVDVRTTGPLTDRRASGSESWVDPVIGGIFEHRFSEQWSTSLRGDIGGFGVGSDFAWQGIAALRWQVSPGIGVVGAYRYIDMDYDDGSGNQRFLYDMAIHGPALGVVFTF